MQVPLDDKVVIGVEIVDISGKKYSSTLARCFRFYYECLLFVLLEGFKLFSKVRVF